MVELYTILAFARQVYFGFLFMLPSVYISRFVSFLQEFKVPSDPGLSASTNNSNAHTSPKSQLQDNTLSGSSPIQENAQTGSFSQDQHVLSYTSQDKGPSSSLRLEATPVIIPLKVVLSTVIRAPIFTREKVTKKEVISAGSITV